jgi:23S rRNA pseudouridine2605 synthase
MSSKHQRRPHRGGNDRPDSADPSDGGSEEGGAERLQKVLAAAGVGSRRDCEELIRDGRVEVDRQVVTELGTKVDPLRHEIRVDGEPLRQPKTLYYAVNKPVGIVTTNFDPERRTRVVDLVPTEERVFAVGRLDRSSEGLILVTNDGEFANRITHPRYGVEKTYLARVAGAPGNDELQKLRKGVYLSDGFCRVQSIVPKKRHKGSTDLVIVLNEGRNRELRRILARVGHKVLRLKRIAVGPIKLADMPVGSWRRLMPNEIDALLAVAKEKRRASKPKRGPRPAKAADSSRESPSVARSASGPPTPRPAPFSEPLSIDDLLRDDLEEGNLAGDVASFGEDGDDGSELQFSPNDQGAMHTGRGEVIEYDPGQPPAPTPTRPPPQRPFQKPFKQRRERSSGRPDARKEQRAGPPRKDFGKKPGKRSFGKPQEGKPQEGRAGAAQGGKKRPFGNNAKANRGGKPFGKPFGKKFGKDGGKPRRGKGR